MAAPDPARDTLAIIGAGPVGLEAAAAALAAGFDVHVFERGDVAAHVQAWGHVPMFTPWRSNVGPAARALLARHGRHVPDDDSCPSGHEFAERVLLPLAATPELAPRVHTHAQVVQVSRRGALRSDAADAPPRADRPFRLLVRDAGGRENLLHAFALLDASGVLGAPCAMGTGGIAARQELYLAPQMSYQCDDVLGLRRARHAGKRTLVVGGGAGAATLVVALAQLAREVPGTSTAWVMRGDGTRLRGERDVDPLPARAALFAAARATLDDSSAAITRFIGCEVEAFEYNSATHRYRVQLAHVDGARTEEVDQVIGQCGYGAERSVVRELQRAECPRTGGSQALAAALHGAGSRAEELRATLAHLSHPEPGYLEIGARAHARLGAFLLPQGHAHVEVAIAHLATLRDRAR